MLGGLNAFTTTPMLIGVLVRVGDIDGARAIAEKLQNVADGKDDAASLTNPDFAWSQWAAFCALEGKTAHVERQLEKTASNRIKAVLCAGVAEGLLALRQQPASDKKEVSHVMKPSEEASVNARAMVEALANHNPVPDLVGRYQPDPIFATNYDWSEYGRVWNAIPVLVGHAEDAWPEMVKHLDDRRYCMTAETMNGFTYNFTVGDMCRDIVARNLSEAYYQKLTRLTQLVHARLRWPEVAHEKIAFKSWCEQRSKKRMYELQMEMCQWAITELKGGDFDKHVSPRRLRAWTAAIEAEIKSLRESQKAIPFGGFGSEEFIPYSPEKAEKLRAEHQGGQKSPD